ncbi:MAG: GIY-YIG nuclease family protein [Silvibacterium sp.]
MKEHSYFVYLMASRTRVLYCGMTNNLFRRVAEHKSGEMPGFSKTYKCHRLVWFEHFQYVGNAIARERQIKNWRREKKLARIQETNSSWADLSECWFQSAETAGPSTSLRSGRDDNRFDWNMEIS